LVCKKQVGHALSVPDREESHLLSEDLGSGEPVSRASAPERRAEIAKKLVNFSKKEIKSEEVQQTPSCLIKASSGECYYSGVAFSASKPSLSLESGLV